MADALPKTTEVVAPLNEALMRRIRRFREAGVDPDLGEDYDFLVFALSHRREAKSQLAQDLWVLFETGERRGGYFVEIGAGDGERLSNTWLLENRYGWTGVLAEPNAAFHERLRLRDCKVSHDCVFVASGATVAFNSTPDPHFSTIAPFSTLDMHAKLREAGEVAHVRTISLNDLLESAKAPSMLDYLSLDTEGSELAILQTFDFSRHAFGLVTVEHNYGGNREEIRKLMSAHGYRRKFAHLTDFDDWYVNDEVCARLRQGTRAAGFLRAFARKWRARGKKRRWAEMS